MAADITIRIADTEAEFAAGRELFIAYAEVLGLDLEFQGFSEELDDLRGMYGRPDGALLLAIDGDRYVGVVGLRRFDSGTAEMKRMFVRHSHQGRGIGRRLTRALIDAARDLGYLRILLDSIRELDRALAIYSSLGFRETDPYRYNPFAGAVFMEYRLDRDDNG